MKIFELRFSSRSIRTGFGDLSGTAAGRVVESAKVRSHRKSGRFGDVLATFDHNSLLPFRGGCAPGPPRASMSCNWLAMFNVMMARFVDGPTYEHCMCPPGAQERRGQASLRARAPQRRRTPPAILQKTQISRGEFSCSPPCSSAESLSLANPPVNHLAAICHSSSGAGSCPILRVPAPRQGFHILTAVIYSRPECLPFQLFPGGLADFSTCRRGCSSNVSSIIGGLRSQA